MMFRDGNLHRETLKQASKQINKINKNNRRDCHKSQIRAYDRGGAGEGSVTGRGTKETLGSWESSVS